MDWMRRNWPDLLIGLALLLVIGGIIATLLNGGNILPFGAGNNTSPATVSTSTTTEPTATQPVTPTEANGGSSATTAEGVATNSTTTENGIAAVDPNAVTMPDDQGGTGTITAVPPTQDETVDAATNAVEAVAADVTEVTTDTTTADTATQTTDVAASSTTTAPYRVSVGAFGSTENAERRAQAFEEAGYPVFTANQGDLVLVLVGPYNNQAEAEEVKAELQSSGLEANPIVYEFTSDDAATTPSSDTATAATDTAQTDTTQAETSPNEEAATASAPTTSTSGRYLQVGAYNSLESATPQRTTLEGLGFSVSTVEENDFVKLLVGPFDDAGISTAQSQLSAQGIESFVR
jgi:cell division septation protein DedD